MKFATVVLIVLCVTLGEATHEMVQGQHDYTHHSLPCGQGTGVLACRGGRECVSRDKVRRHDLWIDVWLIYSCMSYA